MSLTPRQLAWPTLLFLGVFTLIALPAALGWATLYPLPGFLPASIGLALVLALLGAIDLASFRLPDLLTLPLLAAGLALSHVLGWEPIVWRALAAVCGYGFLHLVAFTYERWRGHAGLGLGDAKLLGAAGAWVGLEDLPTVLLAACFTALAWAALQMTLGRAMARDTRLAFGPFLAVGFWFIWVYRPVL